MKIVIKVLLIGLVTFLLFVSIPSYVETNPCQLFPKPPKFVFGLPWKEVSCGYRGFMWGQSVLDYGSILMQSIDQNGI